MSGARTRREWGRRSRLLFLCLVVAVVLAGCASFLGSDAALADGETAAEQFDAVGSYNATVTIEFSDANGTTVWTGTQVVVPGTGEFYERLEGPDGTEITVSDGEQTWLYVRGSDQAQRLDHGGIEQSLVTEISELVEAARDDSDADDSIRLLPFVPQFGGDRTEVPAGPRTVTHEGTETVAGRQAHVISVEHTDGAFTARHYLDAEHYVPLKTTATFDTGDETTEYALTYEEIEFDTELPPDLFSFTPPEGVTVREPFADEDHGTLTALREESSMAVPEPAVPDRFSLTAAERFVPGAETVELTYTAGESQLTVSKTNVTLPVTGGEEVSVGGQTATFTEEDAYQSLTWTCEGNYYSVRGDLDRELLIEVASSIVCA